MGTRWNRLLEAVLTSTHNLCSEQKHENYQNFLSENFHFLVLKVSVYLNRHVFVMQLYELPLIGPHLERLSLDAVPTSTHNLCLEQKYETYQIFLNWKLSFFGDKIFSIFHIYFNRHVFVMHFLSHKTEQKCFNGVSKVSYLSKID